jgi:class 3 adenylate cyclase/tetratricopeptide (TPR) repeat protein
VATAICSNCGTDNKPERKFCVNCATVLAVACPNCGGPTDVGDRFCGTCAAPLGSQAGPPAPRAVTADRTPIPAAAPVAERRVVSILFADLVGFTTFAEGRDAEDVRETLTRYFDLARDVIGRYGGTVEKFIGDAVMAVWGAPVAREDDPERAVRAGLELVDAVRTLGPSIEARAGVLTGEAAVTLGAVGQGMVAGDLVNTASRLQSVAPSGAVLVGEATQRAASKAIVFEAAGEQVLKGKASPVPAWHAIRVVSERGGRNRSDALEAPFVGRADELRLLKDLFHATGREKRTRLVSVIGPAGIGKTRLAWEFLKYVDGVLETVWWHDGRSPAYGDGITFWALGEMVRGRCGLLETDDEPTTRAKIAETLATHVPDPEEQRWIEGALLALLGVESRVGSEQLFGAWRTFFERLAATAPVVMVFEDHHFADSGLLDFVDHLLEWSRNVPIYVLTLARPELLEKRPDWGVGKRAFNSLYLEPLSEAAMRGLLAGLVPGLPQAAVRAIVSRADGIPLYAVETVRMLLADGRLTLDDGAYHPVGDLTTLAVPETLTALIASRLDGLAPDDRALVSDAAVLGQSFTLAGLSAVSGLQPSDLEPRLRGLVRREILALEADPRSPERGQYAFVQALIREVAYGTLARVDRRARHLAAARFFESLGSDELAGGLAGHYLAAHASSPDGPEREALAAQARIALRAAAERAADLGAHAQAVMFYEQALTVTTDPLEEASLHERAAESASAIQRIDDSEAHFRSALERRSAMDDRAAEARTTAKYGRALLNAYQFEPAIALLVAASERFVSVADEATMAMLDGQLARAYFLNNDYRQAVAVADRVLEAAERSDLVDVVADTLITRGSALALIGRPYEGIGAIEAGQRLAAAHSLNSSVLRALNNLASTLQDSDPRAGLEAAQAGIMLARRLGIPPFNLIDNAFNGAIRTGEWDWAAGELEPMLGEELDPLTRSVVLADTTQLRALRGEPTAELVADLEAMPTSGVDPVKDGTLAWTRGAVAFATGRYEFSRTQSHRFAEVFPQGVAEGTLLAARCALLSRDAEGAGQDLATVDGTGRRGRAIDADRTTIRAGLAALGGQPNDALALYRESMTVWRDLGLVWDEALCAIDMASLLGPGEPEVRAAAERARETLVRLRAQPLLERLDAAMAVGSARPDSTPVRAEEQPTSV